MVDKFNSEYIQMIVEFLGHREAGGITEVRIFPKDRYLYINGRREYVGKTVSGYYDDYVKLAQDIQPFDGKASIYVTLNPVKPALLARYNNRLEYSATHTTSDDDILCDLWFVYDTDPKRASDISSTEYELRKALERRDEVSEFLSKWAVTVKGMSGNGGHGLNRLIGYPNNQETRLAKESLTHFLSEKFTDEYVNFDNTVFNMSRIWKLYGTMAVKGDNIPDRPHRRSFLEIPEHKPIPVDLYAKLDEIIPPDWTPKAARATIQPKRKTTTPTNGDYPLLDVEAYLQHYGVEYKVKEKADRIIYELFPCPFNPEHNHGEAHIAQCSDGKMEAACKHNSCAGKGWQEFKAAIGDPKTFYEKKQSSQTPEVTPQKTKDSKIRDDKRTHHLLFLAKRWHHQGNRRKEILAMLTAENESKCEPCLSESEIQSILDKVLPPLKTITAKELLAMEIPEPRWAVPGFIPEGLTILAGRPKVGKSFFGLGVALAVAHGGSALGHIPVEQGEVLFIGLEDNLRRLQSRLRTMLAGEAPAAKLHLLTGLPRMDRGGLNVLSDWLEQHPETRLVVIDTLNKIRPPKKRGADSYAEDYDAIGGLQQFAMERGIAVMVLHHTRKSIGEYEIDEISGTTGVSAAADSILMIRKTLNGEVLYVTGRDVDTKELALHFDKRDCQWEILGDAAEYAISKERQAIIEVLRDSETPLASKEIADSLNQKVGNVRFLLSQLAKDGVIVRQSRGKYTIEKVTNNTNSTNNTNNANKLTNDLLAVVSVGKNATNICQSTSELASEAIVSDVSDVSDVGKRLFEEDVSEKKKEPDISSDAGLGNNNLQEKIVSEENISTNKNLLAAETNITNNSTENKELLLVEDEKIANNSTNNSNENEKVDHPLTDQLTEYLADCPDKWIDLIHDSVKNRKFSLSTAVEASRRMSNGDSQGAWRLIRQTGE
jgi:hypothetical protein